MKRFWPFAIVYAAALFSDPVYEGECCLPPSVCIEEELFCFLCCESKRLYASLDCIGKNRAVELSKCMDDKNLAVQQAAKEMALRQKNEYPNQDTYQDQIQERSGQDAYNERFGY